MAEVDPNADNEEEATGSEWEGFHDNDIDDSAGVSIVNGSVVVHEDRPLLMIAGRFSLSMARFFFGSYTTPFCFQIAL